MRGTGCSGGSFDYFEPLQNLDGYDVIETVARQPWVLHHRVGMLGISYGGISQLFVAATDPPAPGGDRAAVGDRRAPPRRCTRAGSSTPASRWGGPRTASRDALPASRTTGEAWAFKRIQEGDQTCKANQVLHGEAPNLVAQVRANHYYVPACRRPAGSDHLRAQDPRARLPRLPVDRRADRRPLRRPWRSTSPARGASGSRSPTASTSTRWTRTRSTAGIDFLELYVARRAPQLSPAITALAPTLYEHGDGRDRRRAATGPDPVEPTYARALAAFQRLAPIRVLFDNGAGSSSPGRAVTRVRGVVLAASRSRARRRGPGIWAAAGRSAPASPAAVSDEFTWNPRARPATSFTGHDDGSARRPVDGDAGLPLGAEPARDRRVLRERAAEPPTPW